MRLNRLVSVYDASRCLDFFSSVTSPTEFSSCLSFSCSLKQGGNYQNQRLVARVLRCLSTFKLGDCRGSLIILSLADHKTAENGRKSFFTCNFQFKFGEEPFLIPSTVQLNGDIEAYRRIEKWKET